ncbi:MAG: hypothetical protein LQ348_005847 [Seirophora lacunosa]|nr:MAG: hypothetical protein LQ348_005847 [Seirophora lacunosa]
MTSFFGHVPVNNTSVWIPEPNGRGTWSILSSCLITISLCVWSAVHLNVPQHRKTSSQHLRKFKWLAIGLIAPEVVAFVAWQQRYEARRLIQAISKRQGKISLGSEQSKVGKKLQRMFPDITRHLDLDSSSASTIDTETGTDRSMISSNLSTKNSPHDPLTLVHGFYALMGGYAFATDISEQPFLPSSYTRATITPKGVLFLLDHEPDALPYLSPEQIKDKSKADGLKKTLVCAQALWFCVQCITRLAQALPVSLLELNTFAHALCTLVIYLLWWHKPLDIDEPTLLTDPRLFPLSAYMWMTSRVSANGYVGYDIDGRLRDEFDCIWPFETPVPEDLLLKPRTFVTSGAQEPVYSDPSATSTPQYAQPPYSQRRLATLQYRVLKALASLHLYRIKRPPGLFVRRTAIDHLHPSDLIRWRLAHAAIGRYNLAHDIRERHSSSKMGTTLQSRVTLRQRNILFNIHSAHVVIGIALSSLLYGGLHLLAWNITFPTRAEQLLWRVSALCVACNGILFSCWGRVASGEAVWSWLGTLNPNSSEDDRTYPSSNPDRHGVPKNPRRNSRHRYFRLLQLAPLGVLFLLSTAVMPLLWFSYVLARVYLVVESFKNLAHLPPGGFQTPTWPAYFPHIT